MQNAGLKQPLTLADLDAILVDDQQCREQRLHHRVEHRTRAQVIRLREGSPLVQSDVIMAWTADISATGTGLELPIPVTDDRFWLRLAGPANAFIECRLEWKESFPATGLHRCGVQFERELTRGEFERVLSDGDRACGGWKTRHREDG